MMNRRSFSLIELIIVISITGIIAGVLGVFAEKMAIGSARMVDVRSRLLDDGMRAFEMMSEDIRRLRGPAYIVSAGSAGISFRDVDNNLITYAFADGELTRNSSTLCVNVASFSLTYYNEQGSAIAAGSVIVSPNDTDVRLIKARYQLTNSQETKDFVFTVLPRNLR